MTIWVADTSPLIFLAKLDHLNLLRQGADTVFVPEAVLDEIRAKPVEVTTVIEQARQLWLSVRQVQNRSALQVLLADLDRISAPPPGIESRPAS